MRPTRHAVLLCALAGLFFPPIVTATETTRSQGPANPSIQGELVKIEKTILTVKDPSGKERQVKVDQHTAQFGVFHQGVYVQAWVRPDGRTESIVAFRTNRDSERELATRP